MTTSAAWTNDTTPQPRSWVIDNWETTTFTPTAGWVNRFQFESGDTFTTPCPGVLVQERRSVTRFQEITKADGTLDVTSSTTLESLPYETRVVAADIDNGLIFPADETGNYVGTNVSGEDR